MKEFLKFINKPLINTVVCFALTFPAIYTIKESNALMFCYILYTFFVIKVALLNLFSHLDKEHKKLQIEDLTAQKKMLEFVFSELTYPSFKKEMSEKVVKGVLIKYIELLNKKITSK